MSDEIFLLADTEDESPTPLCTSVGLARVLVTGASGYVGGLFVKALAEASFAGTSVAEPNVAATDVAEAIVATDIRATPVSERHAQVDYETLDIRSEAFVTRLREHRIDTVVHLAAVVTPGPDSTAEQQYEIDVEGTRNVLDACLEAGVRRIVVTSSGAAYGYHRDLAPLIDEDEPLRAQESFTYAHNKKLVEELLARYRTEHPELEQVVFRCGMVLGSSGKNLLTALFEKPVVVGVRGVATPFTFVSDQDLVACLVRAVHARTTGVYNVVGDGVMTMREIARRLGKPYLGVPARAWRAAFRLVQRYGLGPYGPEHVVWLECKPVLSNRRLKEEFGYIPRFTSRDAFDQYLQGCA